MIKTLLLLLILLVSPLPASASQEFEIDHVITYSYGNTGISTVKHEIKITNLLTVVFPKTYTLQLRGIEPAEVKVYDNSGPLPYEKRSPAHSQTEVEINLTRPQAGKGKTTSLYIEYPGPPAKKSGQVWEIVLPKLSGQLVDDTVTVKLAVPRSFGHPAYISPPARKSETSSLGKTYEFGGDQIKNSGITAGFGNFQTLNFQLTYHLANPTSKDSWQSISLPPDTYLQRVFYDSLHPRPEAVRVEEDGNWLADYKLLPRQTLTIEARGQAHLLSHPVNPSLYQPAPAALAKYLQPTKYWQSDDPDIKSLSTQLKTPQNIFDFTVKKLQYDPSRAFNPPTRKGARSALNHPSSSLCTEYTDLFIALARAAGIPAREHQGYALQTDPALQPLSLKTDLLHAWPEYWDSDKQLWRAVDPTWTDTSGGLNYFETVAMSHFTFVIHGADPENPPPAGFYKIAPDQKTVQVNIGEYRDYFASTPAIDIVLPFQLLPLLQQTGRIKITNTNAFALYDLPVKLVNSPVPLQLRPTTVSVLPPFASVQVPFLVSSSLIPAQTNKRAIFSVSGYTLSYTIPESNFFFLYALIIGSSLFGFIFLAFLAVKAWHLHLQKRRG